MAKYVLVSQGIKIYETTDQKEAEIIMKAQNNELLEYRQECFDNNEPYADNEVLMFIED